MTDMVERLACAIFVAAPPEEGRRAMAAAPELARRIAHDQARAALAALREPSGAMVAAGQDLLVRQTRVDEAAVWRAMVDAALGQPEPPEMLDEDVPDFWDHPAPLSKPALGTLALAGGAALLLTVLFLVRTGG